MNKLLKIISAFAMMNIALLFFAFSVAAAKEGNIEYIISDNKATIEKLDASGVSYIEIPANLGGCEVAYLSENAIINSENVVSISIPASVEDLGEFDATPFSGMNNLERIVVDENNKYYSSDENGVLYDKSKTTLVQYPSGNKNKSFAAPDSVTYIKSYAFVNCKYLENVESLGKAEQLCEAFVNCKSLKKVNIPAAVRLVNEINSPLFYGCDSLTDIYFGGNRGQWQNLGINPDNPVVKNAVIHFAEGEETSALVTTKPVATAKGTTVKHTEAISESTSETDLLTSKTEITVSEKDVTKETETKAVNADVVQEKQKNPVVKYIVISAIVVLAGIGIFLVKKYKS